MPERTSFDRILELLFAITLIASIFQGAVAVQGQSPSTGEKLILNVYLDKTGKALVTGYVQDVSDLPFLNASQYRYENDTLQLYALTDALTRKDGDLWNLNFVSLGTYDDFHVTFYLPSDLMLKRINVTQGLEYLLSASNQSLVADVQGYEVQDPSVVFEYQQPLQEAGGQGQGPYLALGLAALLILGLAMIWFARRRSLTPSRAAQATRVFDQGSKGAGETSPEKSGPGKAVQERASLESSGDEDEFIDIVEIESVDETKPSEEIKSAKEIQPVETPESFDAIKPAEKIGPAGEKKPAPPETIRSAESLRPPEGAMLAEGTETAFESAEEAEHAKSASEPSSQQEIQVKKERVEVSSEMAAVMETLTARERAILQALIEAGGRMTQADLRYETGTPKSSLSGILLSLERRKIIIKKEWGRTNVIELSDWFLSKKERL